MHSHSNRNVSKILGVVVSTYNLSTVHEFSDMLGNVVNLKPTWNK